jgi:hypothetical protein
MVGDANIDYDDFYDRDDRGLFDRDEMRRERDLMDEMRRERELARRDREDDMRRAADNAARLEELRVEELQTKDLVEAINNPLVKVTPAGRISSRRVMRSPAGRDVIRRSGQFSRANIMPPLPKKRKKNKKHCKNLSSCLRQANAELRTNKGKLRKGKTQADIMRRAQRLLRKMK